MTFTVIFQYQIRYTYIFHFLKLELLNKPVKIRINKSIYKKTKDVSK